MPESGMSDIWHWDLVPVIRGSFSHMLCVYSASVLCVWFVAVNTKLHFTDEPVGLLVNGIERTAQTH